jgi:hypothetical protein
MNLALLSRATGRPFVVFTAANPIGLLAGLALLFLGRGGLPWPTLALALLQVVGGLVFRFVLLETTRLPWLARISLEVLAAAALLAAFQPLTRLSPVPTSLVVLTLAAAGIVAMGRVEHWASRENLGQRWD